MGANSKIEWTDATWNPTTGCSRTASPGCDNCYAIREAHRLAGNPNAKVRAAYEGTTERRNGRIDWTGVVRLIPERLTIPLRTQKPTKFFVDSMSDLFHPALKFEEIAAVFGVMAAAERHGHTFQVLTKRPERVFDLLESRQPLDCVKAARNHGCEIGWPFVRGAELVSPSWPLQNVWLGTSVSNQDDADRFIPDLLKIPAVIRFVSAEPLLGPVDFRGLGTVPAPHLNVLSGGRLDWVIAGGESGPNARPSHPEWFRSVRDQCVAAGVPYFFKQWGEWQDGYEADVSDGRYECEMHTFPPAGHAARGYHVYRVGKRAAGRMLDGREWNEFPETTS